MRIFRRYLIAGSVIVLPILFTLFLLEWLFKFVDGILGKYLHAYLMSEYGYTIPGLGIIFGIILVLVVGFLVLSLSAFKLNASMGTLTAIVIALALIADFFFLPTLLMKLEEKKDEQKNTADSAVSTASA